MQREITIRPKFVGLGFLAFIALIGTTVALLWPRGESISAVNATAFASMTAVSGSQMPPAAVSLPASPTHAISTELNTPQEAAVAFAKAFYAVNYADYEGWLAGLKSLSTEKGYAITEYALVPSIWPAIEKAQTITPVDAVLAEDKSLMLQGHSNIGGDWQIREVQVSIDQSHLWPSMKQSTFSAFLLLGQENGEWRFVSFVTQTQLDQLKKGQE